MFKEKYLTDERLRIVCDQLYALELVSKFISEYTWLEMIECVPTHKERLSKFVYGLNDNYHMAVIDAKPNTIEDSINKACELKLKRRDIKETIQEI